MKDRISTLEKQLETLIAITLAESVGQSLSATAVAHQMSLEISSATRIGQQGKPYAPDQYTLSLHPTDAESLPKNIRQGLVELSHRLLEAMRESGFSLIREPYITLATDPTLQRGETRVIAWHSSDPLQFSKELPPEQVERLNQPPTGAFFIVDGKRHFPLTRTSIKIGRRLDNHLILEDAHVSRLHAQLSVEEGHYILQDLDSTAGTRVNGRVIKKHQLRPGDIVSVASVQLIYGEDPGGPPSETPPYAPPSQAEEEGKRITPLYLRTRRPARTTPYREEKKKDE